MTAMTRRLKFLTYTAAAFALIAAVLLFAVPAHAATTGHRWHAFAWARSHIGVPYVYGGTGPYGFDCSGLVYSAYRHSGFPGIPRTTYSMIAWYRLRPESHAHTRMGDLAFFGSGHVELVAGRHLTLGALEPGTRVGYHHWTWSSWWHPTEFFHVIGSG